ncbi:hypothetical protein Peur_009113 [Populus x canadensis]
MCLSVFLSTIGFAMSSFSQWIEFWGKFAIPKSSSTRRLQLSYFGNDILAETGRIDASTRTFWRVHHSHNCWLLKKRIYFWFYRADGFMVLDSYQHGKTMMEARERILILSDGNAKRIHLFSPSPWLVKRRRCDHG